MAAKNELNTTNIILIGIVSAMLLVVVVVGAQAWFLSHEQAEIAQYEDQPHFALATLQAEQRARISGYRLVDKETQAVAIPIDEAMRIMVQTQGKLPKLPPTTRPVTRPTGVPAK